MIKKTDEVLEYYYKNPDEGTAPSPPHESHYSFFDDENNLNVNNISAFMIPEFEIGETVKSIRYVVDGTYDGEDFLHNKLKRVIDKSIEDINIGNNKTNNIAIIGQAEVTEK